MPPSPPTVAAEPAAGDVPLPPLPLDVWEGSKETLHRFVQIVGKIRLGAAPFRNHWWHAPFSVTARGLTTGPIPFADRAFALDFDVFDHRLLLTTNDGGVASFPLPGLSVAAFYRRTFDLLARFGIEATIRPVPYDILPADPFPDDDALRPYDPEFVHRWWRIVSWSDGVFQAFAGRFNGKTSPIHLFWHSFDLALTRFSGRRAPALPGADAVTREAYSHEVISFGWWPGDARVRAPAYYAYAAPEPETLTDQALRPHGAFWHDTGRGHLALLLYDDLRRLPDPRAALLDFLESAYQAGATTAGWNIEAFATRTAPKGTAGAVG